jgi:hypothetical protein
MIPKLIVGARTVQQRLITPGTRLDYLLLFVLAALPIGLSVDFGLFHTVQSQPFSFPDTIRAGHFVCSGYWARPNWTSLVITLPLALFIVRRAADRLYKLTPRTEKRTSITDLIKDHDSPLKLAFAESAFDGRNLFATLAIVIGIHLIDMHDIASFYWRAKFAPSLITMPPVKWDWTTWFLTNPGSRSLYWKNLLLVLIAYPSQFLIVFFAVSLIILLLRHNLFFLDSIFLRSRAGAGTGPDSYVVLDFNDGNERFGLSTLSGQFNEQIGLLSLAAGLTLISRWVNSDFQALQLFVSKLTFTDISKPKDLLFKILDNSGHPFVTVGQIMFPTVWFLMFLVVMLPASAKWLPLKPANRINGGAKEFLRELLRPGDSDEVMATSDDVDRVAAKFARQPFWPVGDGRAEVLSLVAFFVFFVLLAPLLPVTFTYSLYYGILLVIAFLLSKTIFAAFRYRLYNFDRRLVTSQK